MPGEQLYVNRPLPGAQIDHSHPLAKGLVGCWLLNEAGSRAMDLSPYQNHGALSGSPKRNSIGVEFDKINDSINCGTKEILNITNAFTINLWVSPSIITTGTRAILHHGTITPIGGFLLNQEANIFKGYFFDSAWRTTGTSITTISPNEWYNVSLSYNRINLKLYINSIVEQQPSFTTTINNPVGAYTQIGGVSPTYLLFSGIISTTMIWNRALSDQEIKNLYLSPYSPGGKNMFI